MANPKNIAYKHEHSNSEKSISDSSNDLKYAPIKYDIILL